MKHVIARAAISCLVVFGLISFSPAADAARKESFSQIWFDSSGNVIGQHAEFCNNVQYEGGSQSGAFSLVVHAGCGDRIRECHWEGIEDRLYICTGYFLNYALTASVTGNAGGLSAGEICEMVSACLGFEVELMYGYDFPLVQIYPIPK